MKSCLEIIFVFYKFSIKTEANSLLCHKKTIQIQNYTKNGWCISRTQVIFYLTVAYHGILREVFKFPAITFQMPCR